VVKLTEEQSTELRSRIASEPSSAAEVKRWDSMLDELRTRIAAAEATLDEDERSRQLIADLNRIADGNEIRYFFPFPLSTDTSSRFAATFRKYGIDLLAVPTDEAVRWLKAHRLRGRLVVAVRLWHRSLPTVGLAAVIDPRMLNALETSAAVTGSMGAVGLAGEPNRLLEKLLRKNSLDKRLRAILNAVTENRFSRDWWGAVERRDIAKLKELVANPELRQMPSREMAALAEGLNAFTGTEEKIVDDFLAVALERFPGEFWVHFRLAMRSQFGGSYVTGDSPQDLDDRIGQHERAMKEASFRHLTAALAIRPTSSVARLALGMELIEHRNDEQAGLRMLESAVEADPASPWPHLFIGMHAVEHHDWPRAFRSFKESIRNDPDTGFFMTSATAFFSLSARGASQKEPTDREFIDYFNELIAMHPQHPGGYDLLANYYRQIGDHRSALAALRKAKDLQSPNYVGRPITDREIAELEAQAAWEAKLPAVLRGEIKPDAHNGYYELAAYCATFEKRFALATRFIIEGIQAHPRILDNWMRGAHCAGWAIQASAGHGSDAATVPLTIREHYRRLALDWIREAIRRTDKDNGAGLAFYLISLRDLAPVRDKEALALLPEAERAEWEKLWAEITPVFKNRKIKPRSKREPAPPPRSKS
jgi:tetratricopeptide (TPR) repeat protein